MSDMRPSDAERVVLTGCGVDCGGRCVLKVHVEDGRITRVETDDGEEPQLRACARGRAARQRVYSPDRFQFPLKRVGERGEGRFERISWDEALDTVAAELKRVKESYGPSAILYRGSGPNGVFHNNRSSFRLLNMFGGCTTTWGNISNGASIFASMASYGTMSTGNTRDDLVNSRLIILWGWNPACTIWDTNTPFHIVRARETGARVVCIDPRFTDSAALFADRWIPIRPATDAAMLLAMACVTIKEALCNRAFLDTYTVGFDKFRDYVLGLEDGLAKTPAWAESITGVPSAAIEDLARDYAVSRPAALIAGWAPGRTAYGEQYHRAAIALAAMTGNVGIHGGNAAGWERSYPNQTPRMPVGINPVDTGVPPRRDSILLKGGVNPVASRIHDALVWDAILRGKAGGYPADIKLLWLVGHNRLNQRPNTNKGLEAMKKLDFVVVQEQFMTATARFADILLPACTFLERSDLAEPWLSAPYYVCINKVLEPLYESRTDFQIAAALARRLGLSNFSDKSEEEWLRESAASSPDLPGYDELNRNGVHKVRLSEPYVSFKGQIEHAEKERFNTPSGKIEIYSGMIAGMGNPLIPPVPTYIEAWEGPGDPLAKEYPLQLVSTHPRHRVHSGYGNVPWLKDIEPQALWINTLDAQERGIVNGGPVRVFNGRGQTIVPAKVTERIMPGVVHLLEGGPYSPDARYRDRGGCPNVLTRDEPSPGGATPLNSCLVQVESFSGK